MIAELETIKESLPVTPPDIWRPVPGTTWQWQLTGEIDTSVDAEMFDVDLFNTPEEVIQELHEQDLEPYFDWALNEECFSHHECEALLHFIENGKAVFGVEYELSPEDFCPLANEMGFSFMLKNLDLDAWRIACWDNCA